MPGVNQAFEKNKSTKFSFPFPFPKISYSKTGTQKGTEDSFLEIAYEAKQAYAS
jgi:hypothetical protein